MLVEANVGNGYQGDISVDDFRLSPNGCAAGVYDVSRQFYYFVVFFVVYFFSFWQPEN